MEAEGSEDSTLKQGDLHSEQPGRVAMTSKVRRAGVRASVVARKPGNAGGAKGRRKMEV